MESSKKFSVSTSRPYIFNYPFFLIKMAETLNKFKNILNQFGINEEIIQFEESTKTSQQAADALHVKINQIGKSIVFKTESGKFVLVIASGANRINEQIIEAEVKEKLIKTNAEEIKLFTGYTIGGIPPFGHDNSMIIFVDSDLLKFEYIFCAGGTPNSIFKINPQKMIEITSGKVIKVN